MLLADSYVDYAKKSGSWSYCRLAAHKNVEKKVKKYQKMCSMELSVTHL